MGLTPRQHAAVDTFLAGYAPNDAALVKALLVRGELTSGDPAAVSPKGARGLMQVMPGALIDTGRDPKTFNYDSPTESLRAGADYVKVLRERYGFTNPLQIAAAYNAGPGRVREAIEQHRAAGGKGGILAYLPEETRGYVQRIHATLKGAPPATAEPMGPPAPVPDLPRRPMSPLDTSAPVGSIGTGEPVEGPERPGLLAQFGSGLPEGAAGVADLPAQLVNLAGAATGSQAQLPLLSNAVAPYVAAEPETFSERLARKAGQGAGALGGMTLAAPVILGSAPSVAAVVSALGLGSVMGLSGETARTVAEQQGAGPVGQTVAEIGGSLAVPAATSVLSIPGKVLSAKRAAQDAAAQAKVDLTVAKAALKTEKRAMIDAKSDVMGNARDMSRQLVADAREAGMRSVDEAVAAGQQGVATAQRTGQAAVAEADDAAQGAATLATMREARTGEIIDRMLVQQDPGDRAKMLGAFLRNNRASSEVANSTAYDAFKATYDDVMVPLTGSRSLGMTAEEIASAGVANGMAPDAARSAAQRIVTLMSGDDAIEALPLARAIDLRAELGALFGKKTSGPTRHRARQLFRSLDQAVRGALPDTEARAAWDALRANRTTHAEIFQNKLLTRAFDDSAEGRATANQFVANQLVGHRWRAEDQELMEAAIKASGINSIGHDILKDSVIRHARDSVTRDGVTDYAALRRTLTNREGLAPVFEHVVRDPRERRLLFGALDDAIGAREAAGRAAERIALESAAATRMTQLAEEAATATTAAARRSAQRQVAQVRSDLARRLATLRRMTTSSVRQARDRGEERVARAQGAYDAALGRLPTQGPPNVGDAVLDMLFVGNWAGGPKVAAIIAGARRANSALNWLRIPQNRAFLSEAFTTSVDSAAGKRLLNQVGATMSRTDTAALRSGPTSAAADEDQVQSTP